MTVVQYPQVKFAALLALLASVGCTTPPTKHPKEAGVLESIASNDTLEGRAKINLKANPPTMDLTITDTGDPYVTIECPEAVLINPVTKRAYPLKLVEFPSRSGILWAGPNAGILLGKGDSRRFTYQLALAGELNSARKGESFLIVSNVKTYDARLRLEFKFNPRRQG